MNKEEAWEKVSKLSNVIEILNSVKSEEIGDLRKAFYTGFSDGNSMKNYDKFLRSDNKMSINFYVMGLNFKTKGII